MSVYIYTQFCLGRTYSSLCHTQTFRPQNKAALINFLFEKAMRPNNQEDVYGSRVFRQHVFWWFNIIRRHDIWIGYFEPMINTKTTTKHYGVGSSSGLAAANSDRRSHVISFAFILNKFLELTLKLCLKPQKNNPLTKAARIWCLHTHILSHAGKLIDSQHAPLRTRLGPVTPPTSIQQHPFGWRKYRKFWWLPMERTCVNA